MTRWAVVLAGGVGSRFWPLSTPERPKQLLPLIDDAPLLRNTLDRLAPLVPAERTLVLTNAGLVAPIATLVPELPRENIIAEPRPAGTAAALTFAATEIARRDGRDSTMICVHADWSVGKPDEFRRRLAQAASMAERHEALVTVGIVPTRPDPGFGYIQPGDDVDGDARRVVRFVEKPSREVAERMVRDGYLWNSGIFVWRAGDLIDEVRAHTPEVAPALDAGRDINAFFAAAQSISIDVGVLERSARVLVLPGDFEWDDVGTWAALQRIRRRDSAGNALSGDVHVVDAHRNVVHAEDSAVVLYGVSDLVVITRDGLTVVTTMERAVDLKKLVELLPAEVRDRR
ncbi:MAG: mannose-1-phosphate guanylyltransferase [Gemmatimonadaceae bacterium]